MNPVDSQGGKRKRSLSDDAAPPPPPPSNAPVAPGKCLLSTLSSFLMQYPLIHSYQVIFVILSFICVIYVHMGYFLKISREVWVDL
jgi:hypothetical protein